MEVIAKARFIKMSPRKIRLVAGLIRGMDVGAALAQLRFYRKAAAKPVTKLVDSAVANAEHNFKLSSGNLFIKTITVDAGPVMKRWRARAFGRAAPIKKRSAHITVILAERAATAMPKGAAAAVVKTEKAKTPAKVEKPVKAAKPAKAAKEKPSKA